MLASTQRADYRTRRLPAATGTGYFFLDGRRPPGIGRACGGTGTAVMGRCGRRIARFWRLVCCAVVFRPRGHSIGSVRAGIGRFTRRRCVFVSPGWSLCGRTGYAAAGFLEEPRGFCPNFARSRSLVSVGLCVSPQIPQSASRMTIRPPHTPEIVVGWCSRYGRALGPRSRAWCAARGRGMITQL